MKSTYVTLCLLSLLFAVVALFIPERPAMAETPTNPESLNITGPYAYENLAVFLIHDSKVAKHEDILTLQEALAQKTITIAETGNVNQLLASNNGKKGVYLQSGDIVKGGRQDRVLQHDSLLAPKSKNVALNVFCVEAGRWHGRGGESVQHFGSSTGSLMTKSQKMAVKVSANQGEVWKSVAEAQTAVSSKLGHSVQSPTSQSSLQLSLEDKKLNENISTYVRNIESQLPEAADAVGYAIAVNGNVESADIFASPQLFGKMKAKMLRSGAAEAVAEKGPGPVVTPSTAAVRTLFSDAESGATRNEKQTLTTSVSRKETPKSVVFTTDDPRIRGKSVHKNYMSK